MKRFSQLCQRLESVPFTRDKPEILAEYLASVPAEDASWALYLLLGGQLGRAISSVELERWIAAASDLPAWLWQECREQAADLAEAVALVAELWRDGAGRVAEGGAVEGGTATGAAVEGGMAEDAAADGVAADDLSLAAWIETRLQPLAFGFQSGISSDAEREAIVREWWRTLSLDVSWAVHALALGRFPVHLPKRVVDDALRIHGGDEAVSGLAARLRDLPVAPVPSGGSDAQLALF